MDTLTSPRQESFYGDSISRGESTTIVSDSHTSVSIQAINKLKSTIKALYKKIHKLETHNRILTNENIEYAQSFQEKENENNQKIQTMQLRIENLEKLLRQAKTKTRHYKAKKRNFRSESRFKSSERIKPKRMLNASKERKSTIREYSNFSRLLQNNINTIISPFNNHTLEKSYCVKPASRRRKRRKKLKNY